MADDGSYDEPTRQKPGGGGNPGSDHGHGYTVTVDGTPVVFGEESDAGARFLYLSGEVLVWVDDADEAAELLRQELDADIDVVDEGLAVARLLFSSRFRPLDVTDLLTDSGFDASPNHVLRMASHVEFIGTGLPEPAAPGRFLEDQLASAALDEGSPVVAVVDTGIARDAGLPSTVVGVGAFEEQLTKPAAVVFGHGTFVAALIVVECPSAEVRMFRPPYGADDSNRFGHLTDTQLAAALMAVLDQSDEIDILNLSVGGFTHDGRPPLASGSVIAELVARGVGVVAAAGNDGRRGEPFYPAAQDGVLAVGSIHADGTRSCFSNRGDWVDTVAVGEDVVSVFPATEVHYPDLPAGGPVACTPVGAMAAHPVDFAKGYAAWSGTSFAAARVSGALARTRIL